MKAYDEGRCDIFTTDQSGLYAERLKMKNPDDNVILPEIISKEPLGPVVRQGDDAWFNVVKWTYFALVNAEELGITQANVEEMKASTNPEIKRVLGVKNDGRLGGRLRYRHRPRRGVGRLHHQGRRQLRRDLRAQRGRQHAAEDRARRECPVEERRPAIRTADPLIRHRESGHRPDSLSFQVRPRPGKPAVSTGEEAVRLVEGYRG